MAVTRESNIDLFLDTSARNVTCASPEASTIEEVHCIQVGTEEELLLHRRLFVDASGDGVLAAVAGAETRMGREAQSEFGDPRSPQNRRVHPGKQSPISHSRQGPTRAIYSPGMGP